MNKNQLWFCEAQGREAYKLYPEDQLTDLLDWGLELCSPNNCAHQCLVCNLPDTELGLAIVQAEVSELKSRITLRNRQIRDLRRVLRK